MLVASSPTSSGRTNSTTGTLVVNHFDVTVRMPRKTDGTILRVHNVGTVSSGTTGGRADNPDVPSYADIYWSGTDPTKCVR
jgi:hypothetical protein